MYHDVERHEMELVKTHAGGAEEWYCPTCSRRFIMQWPPNYKRVILEAGDEDAIHSGGNRGAFTRPDEAAQPEQERTIAPLQGRDASFDEDLSDERGNDGESGLSPLFLDLIDQLDFSPLDNLEGGDKV